MTPNDPCRPSAPIDTVKSEAGSLPVPRDWKGPLRPSEIGSERVLEPDGLKVSETFSTPLSTLWAPLKVCLSSDCALPEAPPLDELLLPHAASARVPATAATSRRRPVA